MKDNLRRPGSCARLVKGTRYCRMTSDGLKECPVQYEQNCGQYSDKPFLCDYHWHILPREKKTSRCPKCGVTEEVADGTEERSVTERRQA
jgi:hypothetical protein